VRYSSFSGLLPTISSVRLLLGRFNTRITAVGISCLFALPEDSPGEGLGVVANMTVSGTVRSIINDETSGIPVPDDAHPEYFCNAGGAIRFLGSGSLTTGGGGAVSFTLIPGPGQLTATPASVSVETLEQNDTFTVRNTGQSTATITRVAIETSDRETPDFAASAPGCRSTLSVGEACVYTIAVNSRPQREGMVTIYYRDGLGGERTLAVRVDIAS
jgi:hypothetical protein